MKLRRATLSDYEECKRLYADDNADFLYRDREREAVSEVVTEEGSFSELDEETRKEIEEFFTLTKEKFEHYFNDDYGRFYIFEDNDRHIIGMIELFKIKRGDWKLAFLQVEEEYQSLEVFNQIFNDLMSQKGISTIDVCTISREAIDRLLKLGYTETAVAYFRKVVRPG